MCNVVCTQQVVRLKRVLKRRKERTVETMEEKEEIGGESAERERAIGSYREVPLHGPINIEFLF